MQRRHAHGAGLAGGGDNRIGEEDVLNRFATDSDRIHFGVGRDVGREHYGVVGSGDHLIADGNSTTKWALAVGNPFAAGFDGHLHEFGGIDHRYTLS
jgi:hypothetical protein